MNSLRSLNPLNFSDRRGKKKKGEICAQWQTRTSAPSVKVQVGLIKRQSETRFPSESRTGSWDNSYCSSLGVKINTEEANVGVWSVCNLSPLANLLHIVMKHIPLPWRLGGSAHSRWGWNSCRPKPVEAEEVHVGLTVMAPLQICRCFLPPGWALPSMRSLTPAHFLRRRLLSATRTASLRPGRARHWVDHDSGPFSALWQGWTKGEEVPGSSFWLLWPLQSHLHSIWL